MAGDQSVLKQINRMAIVRLVKSRPSLARGDLAELTGLADSTVSVLVNELVDEGWLVSSSSDVKRIGAGRRPKVLALNPSRLATLGAEIGVDYLAVSACNLYGEQLFSRIIDYDHIEESRSVADTAVLIAEARGRLAALGRVPLGVGLGVPGMVTPEGLLRFAPNLGWRDVPIGDKLAAALERVGAGGLRVTAINDANARALAEYVFGATPQMGSLVYMSVGWGIGAGIIIDDRLVLGHSGFSGEVGHSIIDPGGEACTCGRRGCVETMLSQKGVSRMVTGREAPILSINELAQRLAQGESAVLEAARAAGEQLGLVVHNLLVTLDPAVLVLGGPLGGLPGFVDAAVESLKLLRGASTSHRALVRPCGFGAAAGAVGAAASVLHEILHPVAHAPARAGGQSAAS